MHTITNNESHYINIQKSIPIGAVETLTVLCVAGTMLSVGIVDSSVNILQKKINSTNN